MPDPDAILTDFATQRGRYQDFALTVAALIERLLREEGLLVHSVTQRCKDEASLKAKLATPDRQYGALADITDLAGVRITTYFPDDVDRVAHLIEREFLIDRERSVDKRKLLDPDRFGYLSVHYIFSLAAGRSQLPENRPFAGIVGEIQIRSLLQHAWAEIEHDLGYKSTRSVPAPIRRRFSMLAGLLELADSEFAVLRRQLAEYEKAVPERIATAPETVPIDGASLFAFIKSNALLAKLDLYICDVSGASPTQPPNDSLEVDLKALQFLGIGTIGELESALAANTDWVTLFASDWLHGSDYDTLSRGIALFYLYYVLVAKSGSRERVEAYAKHLNLGPSAAVPTQDRIVATARKLGLWIPPPSAA